MVKKHDKVISKNKGLKIRESESENELSDEYDEKPFGSDNGDFYDPIFDGSDDDAP